MLVFKSIVLNKLWLLVGFLMALLAAPMGYAEAEQNEILLRDGPLVITKEDMIRYINSKIPPSERSSVLTNPDRMATMLQNIYVTRSLAARAEEFDVSLDVKQVAWEQDFKRDTDLAVAIQRTAVERAQSQADLDALANELYIAEASRYMTEKEVDAAHILISKKDRNDEEALALAEKVRQEALTTKDFHTLAKQYSDDKTVASNGGELGTFKQNAMVKPFAHAVFAMTTPGEISNIVESQFGYHVIKLNKIIAPRKLSFSEAKPEIIKTLKARIEGQVRDALLTDTRSKSGVHVDQDLLVKIKNEYVVEKK